MTMRRLLIALLTLMLLGASLVTPAQAQGSWTCNWQFSNGVPSGWTITYGSTTASGLQVALHSTGWYLAEVNVPSGVTVTSATVTYMATQNLTYIYPFFKNLIDSGPQNRNNTTWAESGSGSVSGPFFISIGQSASSVNGLYMVSANMTGTGTNPCPATPTPTSVPPTALPTATPYIINTFATPTPIAIDGSGIYDALQQGNNSVIGLPADLAAAGRPPAEDGSEIFAYVKWFVSPSSADELAGPFAPIVSHTGIFLSVTFAMAVIYAVIWGAVWLFRFVVWVVKFIFLIVDLALQVAQVARAFIGGIVKLLLGG